MDGSLPPVSVVICAYTERRWDDLKAAAASAAAQTHPPVEVTVVVDHNPSLELRARRELTGVAVVANGGPRGLSGARNSGVAAARGEVVAFLDDDATAEPDWLEHLGRGYSGRDVVGVGGAVDPFWLAARPAAFPEEFHWVVGCSYRGMPVVTAPVRNLIGANMSFSRDLLKEVGGFDSGLGRIGTRPLGCEETELCLRARRLHPSGVLVYEPRARVRHRVPPERTTWRYFRSRCFAEGLSKARVVSLAGRGPGLASERAYALSVLPRGALRGLADTLRGDLAGLGRATAIVAGLAWTTAGYLAGTALGGPTDDSAATAAVDARRAP